MSFDSGLTSVTGSVSVTTTNQISVLGTNQTQVNVVATGNGAVQNAYTTTSGKTFYLMGIQCSAGYVATFYKNDGTTAVLQHQSGAQTAPATASPTPIAVYTSGQVVKVNASNTSTYYFWGIEQ